MVVLMLGYCLHGLCALPNMVINAKIMKKSATSQEGRHDVYLLLMLSSVARARLSLAPAQLCPKRRVWELGAELSSRNDGSNSGTAAQVTAS